MELDLPKIYVVKSTREGVTPPIERQVVGIKEGVADRVEMNGSGRTRIDRYILDGNTYPFDADMLVGETSNKEHGYSSGCGDLWGSSIFYSFSRDEAENYYWEELERVQNKYLKPKLFNSINSEEELMTLLEECFYGGWLESDEEFNNEVFADEVEFCKESLSKRFKVWYDNKTK